MQIVSSIGAMQRLARKWQRAGTRTGFVPTMGYLHAGHLSLAKRARQAVGKNGKVVVSIYVNPTQFGPKEDLAKYPRDLKRDLKLLRGLKVDVVFTQSDAEMYSRWGETPSSPKIKTAASLGSTESRPTGFSTFVVEGKVATVVAKLFNIVLPEVAVFGQKDFQQAAVIKRMVADLNFPVKIVIAPTLRERDGLAMSSRNKYLDLEQRAQAVILFHALQAAQAAVKEKSASAARMKADLKEFITAAPLARLDYAEFFDPETLEPIQLVKRGTQMALAVFFGKTRLIDNAQL